MKDLDKLSEGVVRGLARMNSRRGVLATIGGLITGGAMFPVLPVARASGGPAATGYDGVAPQSTGNPMDPGDPASCDYWRYCGIDGFLCSCCGGTASACPPGTEMSPITWIGTCLNRRTTSITSSPTMIAEVSRLAAGACAIAMKASGQWSVRSSITTSTGALARRLPRTPARQR